MLPSPTEVFGKAWINDSNKFSAESTDVASVGVEFMRL